MTIRWGLLLGQMEVRRAKSFLSTQRSVSQQSFLPTFPFSPIPIPFDFSCLKQPCPKFFTSIQRT
jgi:hypothetical protein